MLLRLFLLFTLVPLVELVILIQVGQLIGLLPTLALVIGTGAAGAWLARREGARSWRAVQRELESGRLPGRELVHGVIVLIAGIVLVTPGVLTDLAGLLLMLRPVRQAVIRRLQDYYTRRLEQGTAGRAAGPGYAFFWADSTRAGQRHERDDRHEGMEEIPGDEPGVDRPRRIIEM